MSLLSVMVCVVASVSLWMIPHPPASGGIPFFLHDGAAGLLLTLVFGAVLFTIRAYTITPDAILVHRLLWDTRLPREGLLSATRETQAMEGSLKLFGNGGMFSFTGWFWSKRLGRFRAYATNLNCTVVLRWEKRTAVVSPDNAEEFVRELMG
ncbi:MAG: PH domain-containing protein [Verrucomicrobia bacterium]|nr:PH domain-containing protein [Verrucomicrobiota bacterium]